MNRISVVIQVSYILCQKRKGLFVAGSESSGQSSHWCNHWLLNVSEDLTRFSDPWKLLHVFSFYLFHLQSAVTLAECMCVLWKLELFFYYYYYVSPLVVSIFLACDLIPVEQFQAHHCKT